MKVSVPACIPAGVGLPRNHRAEPVKAGWAVIIGIQAAALLAVMTRPCAVSGSALMTWMLTCAPAGMHAGTLTFTASAPGTYHYLCPVPGHARDGMTGTLTVR